MQIKLTMLASALALAVAAAPVHAQVSEAEAARLGQDLTPLGAERAGNEAGTIPEWDGGLTGAPEGHVPGGHYADPFADDGILFTIDASNLNQHRENLTPGQIAMLETYPTWKMNVTRRVAARRFRRGTTTRQWPTLPGSRCLRTA